MRELIGKDENKRQTFRYRETRDKEKENRMNNIVWMQCMDCSARRSWPFGRCEGCRYNIARIADDPAKAEEIFISQMAAKDAGDRAEVALKNKRIEDTALGLKMIFVVFGIPLLIEVLAVLICWIAELVG